MDKAKTMMHKMGWEHGRGLGKNEDGIVSAIKPNTQRSRQGLGYSEVDKDSWWVRIYDEAAKNIANDTKTETDEHGDGEKLKMKKRKTSNERDASDVLKIKKQKKSKKPKKHNKNSESSS